MITLTEIKYEIKLLEKKYKTSNKRFKMSSIEDIEYYWEYMKEYDNNIKLLNKLIKKYKK